MIVLVYRNRVLTLLGETLKSEFIDLGYECCACTKYLLDNDVIIDPKNIYILIGPQLYDINEIKKIRDTNAKIIGITTEGLHVLMGKKRSKVLIHLNMCDILWCHQKNDIDLIKSNTNISEIYYFPSGYSKYFNLSTDLEKYSKPQKKIIFLGHLGNGKRTEIWKKLSRAELVFTCWDKTSYAKMFNTNYLYLNLGYPTVKFYGSPYRIMPLISNNCLIISDNFDDHELNNLVIMCDNDKLDNVINDYLDNPKLASEKALKISEWARDNFSMKGNLIRFGCKDCIDKLLSKLNVI